MRFKAVGKATTLALLLALSSPAGTASARLLAPPGNSEADQYFETVPGATGPRSPNSAKTAHSAVSEGKLGAATERGLQRRGTTGQAVASVVAQTAPAGRGTGAGAGARSAPGSAASEAPEKQGLGTLFPLVLVATAAAALAFAALRWRRSAAQ